MRRPVPDSLSDGPFSLTRASSLGVTRKMLRGGGFQRLQRGIYAVSNPPPGLSELIAAALLVLPPDAVAFSVTGLQLYGVDVGDPIAP